LIGTSQDERLKQTNRQITTNKKEQKKKKKNPVALTFLQVFDGILDTKTQFIVVLSLGQIAKLLEDIGRAGLVAKKKNVDD
jgi:hypothetical protein